MCRVEFDAVDRSLAGRLTALSAEGAAIGMACGDRSSISMRGSVAGSAVDARSVFYGASLTKQLIGLLLAEAICAGRAGADDSILRWVPELPAWMGDVQLRHLAHHLSDLPDVADPARGVPRSNAEVLARFRASDRPRTLRPGISYRYSNSGYVLLAEALGRIAGTPVPALAADRLFEPLDLPDTRLGGHPVHVSGCPDPPGTVGDGGLWTSPRDLLRWLRASNEARFGREVHDLAETADAASDGYAWGVRVRNAGADRMITHGGSWHRWQAFAVRLPGAKVAVAVLSLGGTQDAVGCVGRALARELRA